MQTLKKGGNGVAFTARLWYNVCMKVRFLGTAAAEGLPAVFCNCDHCNNARRSGGKDIHTRNQLIVDDDLLIDFPPDAYAHMLTYGLDFSRVKDVLISHAHMDHCYVEDFCMRGTPYAVNPIVDVINLWCNPTVAQRFEERTAGEFKPNGRETVNVNVVHPYTEINLNRGKAIALPAIHTAFEECLVYLIERDGKSALILNDTGILPKEFYERAHGFIGRACDMVSFDCTYGDDKHGAGRHMGFGDIKEQIELAKSVGIIGGGTRLFATHFSHNAYQGMEKMQEVASTLGMTATYDGLEVEL